MMMGEQWLEQENNGYHSSGWYCMYPNGRKQEGVRYFQHLQRRVLRPLGNCTETKSRRPQGKDLMFTLEAYHNSTVIIDWVCIRVLTGSCINIPRWFPVLVTVGFSGFLVNPPTIVFIIDGEWWKHKAEKEIETQQPTQLNEKPMLFNEMPWGILMPSKAWQALSSLYTNRQKG